MDGDSHLGRDADLVERKQEVVDLAHAAALRSFDRHDARVDGAAVDCLEDRPPRREGHGLRTHECRQDALLAERPGLSLECHAWRAQVPGRR